MGFHEVGSRYINAANPQRRGYADNTGPACRSRWEFDPRLMSEVPCMIVIEQIPKLSVNTCVNYSVLVRPNILITWLIARDGTAGRNQNSPSRYLGYLECTFRNNTPRGLAHVPPVALTMLLRFQGI